MLPRSSEWTGALPCWCFLRVHAGEGYWVSRHERQAIAAGQALILPPSAAGLLRVSQIGPMAIQQFQLCIGWLSGLISLSERQRLEKLAAETTNVFVFPATHPLAERFARLAANATGDTPLVRRCELLALAAEALAGTPDLRRNGGRARRETPILASERFQHLIWQFTEKEILDSPVEQLAQCCNCSVRHFRVLFRMHFGASFHARQMQMRLLDAANRLHETEIEVATLARECGYRRTRSFALAFRREFGCTPAEWRRRRNIQAVLCQRELREPAGPSSERALTRPTTDLISF